MFQEYLTKILAPLLRTLMWVFFRKIEVVNAENVPTDVPIIFTPNHPNSLIDGIMALTYFPRDPRPLGKSTLWKNPITRPLVVAANAIPVHRPQDASNNQPLDNSKMFEACTQALKENNCIALFPEGTSHDEPKLLPLKTGAARIALSTTQQDTKLSVRIVPVGLTFDDKKSFRSRVLIYIGKPIDPMELIKNPDPESHEQVNDLTNHIKKGIKSVTLNYPSWEEGNSIQRAASIYLSLKGKDDASESMVGQFSLHKQMSDTFAEMKEKYPHKVSRVISAVNSYDRLLRVLGIQHEHFMQDRPGIIHTVTNLQKASLFLVRLPLAIMGIFLNAIPHLLTKMIGTSKMIPPNRASTVMMYTGIVLYPLFWTLEANILGNGLMPGWFWWLLAPLSGIISLLFLEQNPRLLEEMTTYLRLQTQSEIREEIEDRLDIVEHKVSDYIKTANSLAKPKAKAPAKAKPATKKAVAKNPAAKKTAAKKAPAEKAAAKKSPAKKTENKDDTKKAT